MKTMKKITKLLMVTAVYMAPAYVAFTPGEAVAWRATEATLRSTRGAVRDVRDAVRDVEREIRSVEAEVQATGEKIIQALRLATGESSSYADKQIEAMRRFTDAGQQNDSERLRQEFRAKAEGGEFDPAPSICLLAGLFRGEGASGPGAVGTQATQRVALAASGADPAVRAGGTTLARAIMDRRAESQGLMGVEDPTVDPAAILMNPTIQADGENAQAFDQLLQNMIDPIPPRPILENEMATPEGVVRAARRTVQETRNNANREVIAMLANMRSPVQPIDGEGGGSFRSYLDDIANYNRPVPEDGVISELQALDIRTLRYYAPKPEVFQARAAMSEKGLLQELLDAVAINNRLLFIQLELDSRRAAVDTQMLSIMNND
jgi:hypothetical protein